MTSSRRTALRPSAPTSNGARAENPQPSLAPAPATSASSKAAATREALPPWKEQILLSRDRRNPSLYDSIALDPTLPMDKEVVLELTQDMRRWSRRAFGPSIRVGSLAATRIVRMVKRVLPFEVASEPLLNWYFVQTTKHFASPGAKRFLMRHFSLETAIVNFIARNCGADDVREADLFPTREEHVGDWNGQNAIIQHDANLFNLMIDLGLSKTARVDRRLPLDEIDFRPLDIPELEISRAESKIMNIDLHSAYYLMILALASLLTEQVAERAINSFQFDESLMTAVANITGNDIFRTWTPVRFVPWLGSPTGDPARDLHWHMLVHEYAYHELCKMRDEQTRQRAAKAR